MTDATRATTVKRTYRNSAYPIVGWAVIVIVSSISMLIVYANLHPRAWVAAVVAPPAGSLCWFVFRVYVHARVESDASGLIVINPFSTKFTPWSELKDVKAAMLLIVEPVHGPPISAWAVQAAKIARITGRRSFADDVAEDLNKLLVASQGKDWTSEAPRFAMPAQERRSLRGQAAAIAIPCVLAGLVPLLRLLH